MKTFKQFYEDRHGVYPGSMGETHLAVFERLTETFSDYVDEVVIEMKVNNVFEKSSFQLNLTDEEIERAKIGTLNHSNCTTIHGTTKKYREFMSNLKS